MVWWNSGQGAQSGGGQGGGDSQGSSPGGEILYNDRVAIREPLIDPSPYLAIINQWLLAAARQAARASLPHQPNLSVPAQALTVAQAQMVKNTLLDGLFSAKRQAPITVGGQTYNGGDGETHSMANQIAAASQLTLDSANSVISNGVGTALTSLASSVVSVTNSAFSTFAGTKGYGQSLPK
jgi:hypothetical protein